MAQQRFQKYRIRLFKIRAEECRWASAADRVLHDETDNLRIGESFGCQQAMLRFRLRSRYPRLSIASTSCLLAFVFCEGVHGQPSGNYLITTVVRPGQGGLINPAGLTVDPAWNLYLADNSGNRVIGLRPAFCMQSAVEFKEQPELTLQELTPAGALVRASS
jgi:hypothetical protein